MNAADKKIRSDFGFMYRRCGSVGAPRAIVALHGSGADESSMLPFAHAIDPDALVLAPRGRIDQDGERRWFLKRSPVEFDQQSIHAESRAFAAFLDGLYASEEILPDRTIFLGYSNGGNLVHSTLLLHPGRISKAIFLRCMPVLNDPPRTDLIGKEVLIVAGANDETYGPFARPLVQLLQERGAHTSFSTVASGHEFGELDIAVARRWIRTSESGSLVNS